MPYVRTRTTMVLTDEQKETLKDRFGKGMALFGKSEKGLMVTFDGGKDIWYAGKKREKAAYVEVLLMGDTLDDAACLAFTKETCAVLESELAIPGKFVYVTFHLVPNARWGWNSRTF